MVSRDTTPSKLPVRAPILVTSGTGTLGRQVVSRLRAAGWEIRVLTRERPAQEGVQVLIGDLMTGAADLGGPRAYSAAELVRGYLRASHQRRLIVPVRLPGRAARAVREGATLASPIAS